MTDFVVYHHPNKMPYTVSSITQFDAFTDKPVASAVGGRVWVIGREGTAYFLGLVFRADSEVGGAYGFAHGLAGRHGHIFGRAGEIGNEPWFPALQRVTGNFAFGLTAVSDPTIVQGLEKAACVAGYAQLP